jgi:hypothetical protein
LAAAVKRHLRQCRTTCSARIHPSQRESR